MTTAAAHPIEIEGLCTRCGEAAVLEDITLDVRAGEIVGLLGLNGAGKTSLIKAVLMLVEPRAGAVRLFGAPHRRPDARSRLAYLPERFQPPGHLSGYDFVRLTLAVHGGQTRRSRIASLAEQLDLDRSALRRPISSYTKSMAQKLGLLAMLLTERPLLVLDEPMSGLAPKSRQLAKRQLLAYRARGRTILLSSELPADHDGLCDRIAILHRGRLVEVGAPDDLRARHGAPTLASAFLAATMRPCTLPLAAS